MPILAFSVRIQDLNTKKCMTIVVSSAFFRPRIAAGAPEPNGGTTSVNHEELLDLGFIKWVSYQNAPSWISMFGY